MKTKHLFIPAVVLAILLAAGVSLRRQSTESRSAADQAGMVRLIDEKYGDGRIRRITLSSGALSGKPSPETPAGGSPPGEPERGEITLVKLDGGAWTVESARNAPANADTVTELLSALRNLTGDLHAEREESHKRLGVDADGALRVVLGGDAGDLVLHVGGRPGGEYGESYVRRNDESNVYRVPVDLRRAAGLGYAGAGLETKTWLDLNLFSAPTVNMETVELDYSGHGLVVRRGNGADGGGSESEAAAWELVEGGRGREFKPEAFSEWLRGLPSFAASGMAEPSLMEDAARAGGTRTLEFAGGSEGKDVSVRAATANGVHFLESSERPGFVYTADDAGFNRVFPPLASLLNLRLLPGSGAIDRVESDEWILTREIADDDPQSGRWLAAPAGNAGEPREIQAAAAENYLKRLAELEGTGFAPDVVEPPIAGKKLTVRVGGADIVFSFGPEENGTRPAYAKGLTPLTVNADDVRAVFSFPGEGGAGAVD